MNSLSRYGVSSELNSGKIVPAAISYASKKMSTNFIDCLNSLEVAIVQD